MRLQNLLVKAGVTRVDTILQIATDRFQSESNRHSCLEMAFRGKEGTVGVEVKLLLPAQLSEQLCATNCTKDATKEARHVIPFSERSAES